MNIAAIENSGPVESITSGAGVVGSLEWELLRSQTSSGWHNKQHQKKDTKQKASKQKIN